MNAKVFCLTLLVFVIVAPLTWAASKQDVENVVNAMTFASSVKALINSGFQRGIDDERLTADGAFLFLQKISTSGGAIEDRQTILTAIAQTLLEDITVEMLTNNVELGLARGFPMDVIADEIVERRQTLVEVKGLLAQKGVQQQQNGSGFLRPAVDAAIFEIATVLENHVRSGKEPGDGTLLDDTLAALQRDGRVSEDLVQTLANALSESDLAGIAVNIDDRT